jgi:hypothetical protein
MTLHVAGLLPAPWKMETGVAFASPGVKLPVEIPLLIPVLKFYSRIYVVVANLTLDRFEAISGGQP